MTKSTVVATLTANVSTAEMYQKDAIRTKSDAFFGNAIKRGALVQKLQHIVDDNQTLDWYKKAMFYGRNLGEHTPVLPNVESMEIDDRQFIDVAHAIVGINTEGGELAERFLSILKRFDNVKMDIDMIDEQDKINIFEELGDVLWYVAIAAEALGVTVDHIMFANINKLKNRFPEKFTQDEANNRNIEKEQESLEKDLTASADWNKLEKPKQQTEKAAK